MASYITIDISTNIEGDDMCEKCLHYDRCDEDKNCEEYPDIDNALGTHWAFGIPYEAEWERPEEPEGDE